MTRLRLARPAALAYLGVLIAGLALLTASRIDDPQATLPIWIAAITGTVLGQIVALCDLRGWLAVLTIGIVTYFVAPPLELALGDRHLLAIMIAAALGGAWSLGDRTALASFWFPAVVWMWTILDHSGRAPDGTGTVLLVALAAAFVWFLRAREARRVLLWSSVASEPLATNAAPAVLREAPTRWAARASWGVLTAAIAAAITAWVAPQLWQLEYLAPRTIAMPRAIGVPCCPYTREAEQARTRVNEFLARGRGHDAPQTRDDESRDIDCRVCEIAIAHTEPRVAEVRDADEASDVRTYVPPPTTTTTTATTTSVAGGADGTSYRANAVASAVANAASPTTTPPPTAHPSMSTSTPAPVPAAPPKRAAAPHAPVRPRLMANRAPSAPAPYDGPRVDDAPPRSPSLLRLALLAAIAALAFPLVHLGLRPLRRAVTLRHLRAPLWRETVDQRASNAWQLALVGLRDAGWRPESGESPRELAARVGIAGVARCAEILERARHGLGLDAGDLAAMCAAADDAYASARAPLGPVSRAASWLRWPLT